MTDGVKSKIRQLLSIAADDAASEAEIENALAIARKLMTKHHLSEDELHQSPEEQMEAVRQGRYAKGASWCGRRIYAWEAILGVVVADLVGGVDCYSGGLQQVTTPSGLVKWDEAGDPVQAKPVVFFGLAEDVAIANLVFDETRLLVISLARLRYGKVFRGDGAAYCEGFVQGLESQLGDSREAERLECRGAADRGDCLPMVLSERRDALIALKIDCATEWLASPEGGEIVLEVDRRRYGTGNTGARLRGWSDGRNHDVDTSRSLKLN